MRYAILGTTRAHRDDGSPVALGGVRLRALLTALARHPGRVRPADALIAEIWDGDPPADATGALQALVGRLRRALGREAVGSAEGGYRLCAAPDDVDLHRFERLADEGARALAGGDPARAAALLDEALALWQGPALTDLPGGGAGAAAARAELRRLDARRSRLAADLELGRADRALPELAALCTADPLNEPLQALRIRALRDTGRRADALAAYEEVRRTIADRLGADPSAGLRSLHAELLSDRLPPEAVGAGAPRSARPAAPGTGEPVGPPDNDARASMDAARYVPPAAAARHIPPSEAARHVPASGAAPYAAPSHGAPYAAPPQGAPYARPSGATAPPSGAGPDPSSPHPSPPGAGPYAPPPDTAHPGRPGEAQPSVAGEGDREARPRAGEPSDTAPEPSGERRPGPRAATARPGNMRARLTSFVGRESDLDTLRGDLAAARLVTLLGPGGAGKTRLSQEAAEAVADHWPDGVWFAELAPVEDPQTVPETVLTTLGGRETVLRGSAAELRAATDPTAADPLPRLAEHCARRRMLLVLDNCEHVIGAAAELAEFLLVSCPDVTVLATSREPLGVPGELVRPVEPLPDPVALRLLADRGAAARPGFRTEDDPEACAEICRRLDGLPLAVELAAARLRLLTPRQLADRLDDRFRLLTSGSRTVLPRQQTLRAVVDWSWDLLDDAERAVLRRLSVFAGGCDLPAAEEVCGDGSPGPDHPDHGSSAHRSPAEPLYGTRTGPAEGRTGPADGRTTPAERGTGPANGWTTPADGRTVRAQPRLGPPPSPTPSPGFSTAPGPSASPGIPRFPAPAAPSLDPRDIAALLGSLVDKSLLVAEPSADGSGMRYRLLETVAEYAAARLDEAAERAVVEHRHLVHFRELARTADPLLRGPDQRRWLERLEQEHDNLRIALRRAIAARDEHEALCLVLSLGWFWQLRDHRTDARFWSAAAAELGPDPFRTPVEPAPDLFEHPIDAPPPMPPHLLQEARRGVRLLTLANMEGNLGDAGSPAMREGLRGMVSAYRAGQPQTCRVPGFMWYYAVVLTGEFEQLRTTVDAAVDGCRAYGFTWELAFVLQFRARLMAEHPGKQQVVRQDADESLEIFVRLGDMWGVAEALSSRGEARERCGEYRAAAEDFREAIRYAQQLGALGQVPLLRTRLGGVLIEAGEDETGERMLREALAEGRHSGQDATTFAHLQLAVRLGRTGRTDEARSHLDQMLAEFRHQPPELFEGVLRSLLGWLDILDGRPEEGLRNVREALVKSRDPLTRIVAPSMPVVQLLNGAHGHAALGGRDGAERAARLLGAYDALIPDGHHASALERETRVRAEEAARALLTPERYERGRTEGGGLTVEEATALV
ncbi:AfsR/SARP family transcriptional regulator [Streptomyces sp. bgisy100]|uniref:AfsR/SARP family transcriptional regulator n=1 Tax=Streptomyces sp. bgisy100 TaxID=3413783 RepID=UPI003D7048D3